MASMPENQVRSGFPDPSHPDLRFIKVLRLLRSTSQQSCTLSFSFSLFPLYLVVAPKVLLPLWTSATSNMLEATMLPPGSTTTAVFVLRNLLLDNFAGENLFPSSTIP